MRLQRKRQGMKVRRCEDEEGKKTASMSGKDGLIYGPGRAA